MEFEPMPGYTMGIQFYWARQRCCYWAAVFGLQWPVVRYWMITRQVPYLDDTWETIIVKGPVNLSTFREIPVYYPYLIKYPQIYRHV